MLKAGEELKNYFFPLTLIPNPVSNPFKVPKLLRWILNLCCVLILSFFIQLLTCWAFCLICTPRQLRGFREEIGLDLCERGGRLPSTYHVSCHFFHEYIHGPQRTPNSFPKKHHKNNATEMFIIYHSINLPFNSQTFGYPETSLKYWGFGGSRSGSRFSLEFPSGLDATEEGEFERLHGIGSGGRPQQPTAPPRPGREGTQPNGNPFKKTDLISETPRNSIKKEIEIEITD